MEIKLEARIAPAVRWSCTAAFFTAALFQMPILFSLLLNWGVVKHSFLCKNRKYAFFSILLIASLLSPPDVATQIVLASGAHLFYEFFVWCAIFYHKWYEPATPAVPTNKRTP